MKPARAAWRAFLIAMTPLGVLGIFATICYEAREISQGRTDLIIGAIMLVLIFWGMIVGSQQTLEKMSDDDE